MTDTTFRRTRPRGFARWNPRPESHAVVQDVKAVLHDYHAQLPLTTRKAFYPRGWTRGFPTSETADGRRCKSVSLARRARPIGLQAIRDAIEGRRDADTAARLLERETDMRADLVARLGGA